MLEIVPLITASPCIFNQLNQNCNCRVDLWKLRRWHTWCLKLISTTTHPFLQIFSVWSAPVIQPSSHHWRLPAHWKIPIFSFIASCWALAFSPPTLSNSWRWLNTLNTDALTDRPNPVNDPYKLESMQDSCHSVSVLSLQAGPTSEASSRSSSCWPLL